MTVVGKGKGAKAVEEKPNAVPQSHGLLASIPKEIDVRCTFRLEKIEVIEIFTEEAESSPAKTIGEIAARALGTEKPEKQRWTEKHRVIEARWALDTPDPGGEIVVIGRSDLDGVTFDDAGKPSDPAKWAEIVTVIVDEAIEEGEVRIRDLLAAGVEAELNAEKDAR